MKSNKEETKMTVMELSKEELQNICGGAWWEVRFEGDKLVFIFHPHDE